MQSKQRPLPVGGRGLIKMVFSIKLCDGGRAEVPTFAGFVMLAYPDFIKLVDFVFVRHDSGIFEQARMSLAAPSVHGLLHDFRVIRQDASLEVTSCFCFHADAGTC